MLSKTRTVVVAATAVLIALSGLASVFGQECASQIVDDVTEMNALTGQTIRIPCLIRDLDNGTVVWQFSKKKIPEFLTVGLFSYRRDKRVKVVSSINEDSTQSWDLVIDKVQLSDHGFYYCRVVCGAYSVKKMVNLLVDFTLDLKMEEKPSGDNNITLICNSSLSLLEVSKKQIVRAGYHRPSYKADIDSLKFFWMRRDPYNSTSYVIHTFSINKFNMKDLTAIKQHHSNSSSYEISSKNYQVEYFFTPFIHSKLHIFGVNVENNGYYKCGLQNNSAYIGVYSAARLRASSFNSAASISRQQTHALTAILLAGWLLLRASESASY